MSSEHEFKLGKSTSLLIHFPVLDANHNLKLLNSFEKEVDFDH